ncbi:MAG: 1,4-alpha-glucan branching protein GlgB [Rhodospirillaceae bacterium]|nr:1,4-alpha-glucan branching protein GlgB [Rhodospirillaceae bacterium]
MDRALRWVDFVKAVQPFQGFVAMDVASPMLPQRAVPRRHDGIIGELDLYLMGEGRHWHLHHKLGAHLAERGGMSGVAFALWAPNARRVSVVGDFNAWDAQRHKMQTAGGSGVWQLFIPGLTAGALYKYEIEGRDGDVQPLKADPYGAMQEIPPHSASVVADDEPFPWTDEAWMQGRRGIDPRRAPMSIYEVHLGSWARADGNRMLTYAELADQLIDYVKDMGFTHIELLPLAEHPFYGSWGYQPLSLFSPTRRYGDPRDLKAFINRAHNEGIGVVLDWVVSHFPEDGHGLARFDGTCLYEHDDPRQGRQPEWNTLIYNYGRTEVVNFLICNALLWLEDFHVDALRADAVASILYLDYAKQPGEWIPNTHGGNENLDAVGFLQRLNEVIYERCPGAFTIAEDSTAWPMVSRPTYVGGLGFGFKWNMGWMNDTLRYMRSDPVHRKYHHGDLTFGLLYGFHENFILPLSHDEVVHGKGSLLSKMPGDVWQKFANLRAYLAFFYAHPGKKLLFMGAEIAQWREWNHETSLDWHLLQYPEHRGMQALVRELNHLHKELGPLHERDCEGEGFAWIDPHDSDNNVISFLRFGADQSQIVVVVCNFSPVVRRGYRVGVPKAGYYRERLNTDSNFYGGSNVGNAGGVGSESAVTNDLPHSLVLTLPPLATLVFQAT